jgi:hypothetical protein
VHQLCKKQLSLATYAEVSEISNESSGLLDHDTRPPQRGRTSLACCLLVAWPAGGILGMAAMPGSADATHWRKDPFFEPDGFKVDRYGNIFGARPGGISVIAPDDTLLGTIETVRPT